jgi:formylglycine-generating enzyme required for sulfatase activity
MTPGPGVSDCTPSGGSCCAGYVLPTGTFYRSYDGVTSGHTTQSFPASVASFQLDQYEITVGRLRRFVSAVVSGWLPATGSGKHTHLATGQGLSVSGSPGSFEQGWDSTWNSNLTTSADGWNTNLACGGDSGASAATWTLAAGAGERLPANCITWYEAYAFCIWDGAFLPSEAEWNYAASGGSEQRVFPWSSPAGSLTIDCSYANYYGGSMGNDYCVLPGVGGTSAVGSESPKGDGKWGQSDLGGNVFEWTLDYAATYQVPCPNCAYLSSASARAIRGGAFGNPASFLYASTRNSSDPTTRSANVGARCARVP